MERVLRTFIDNPISAILLLRVLFLITIILECICVACGVTGPSQKTMSTNIRRRKKGSKRRQQYGNNIFYRRLRNKAMAGGLLALRYLNVEKKFLDSQQTATTITTTPLVVSLPVCAQGDTDITRDGNQIKLTNIQFNYTIAANGTATVNRSRIMIVLDKQANNLAATLPDVLKDTTANDAIVSAYNENERQRFVILYDQVHCNAVSSSKAHEYKSFNRKLDLHIRYDANNGDVTDLTSNNLLLMAVGNEATNGASLVSFIRLSFVDN
jgi:hypothetical protein